MGRSSEESKDAEPAFRRGGQHQPDRYQQPQAAAPARRQPIPKEPLGDPHQDHQDGGLPRVAEQPTEEVLHRVLHTYIVGSDGYLASSRTFFNSRISAADSFLRRTKRASIGLSDPPNTRSRKD